jgi:ElaB/YqjD/DUF883 family membrane-anchored ribosome-binding protein
MLDQLKAKETAANNEGFLKGAIDAAGQVAQVGLKVEKLKKTAANAIDDGMVDARRMVKRGVYAAEDFVDDTAHRIKKDPLRSVGITFGVGLGLGVVVGWLVGHRNKAH